MFLLLSRKMNRNRIKGPRRTQAQPRVEVLEGRALLSNLLVNGDFSQGDTGFTSLYHPYPNPGSSWYTVGTETSQYNPINASVHDHTTGTGLMFIADAPTSPNTVAWQETVNVSRGTDYTFSGWAASWGQWPNGGYSGLDPSPAQLRFFINGVQVGSDFPVIAQDGQWSQFSVPWNSGTSDVATVQIVDTNTASIGNDFVLDDLSFEGQAASNIVPRSVQPQATDLTVTYEIMAPLDPSGTYPISIFWAKGTTGSDVLPNDKPSDALYTYNVSPTQTPGSYTFVMPGSDLTTAPNATTHLLVVADPDENIGGQGNTDAIFAVAAHMNDLTPAQLQKLMPTLTLSDAERYAPLLNSTMAQFSIRSLEQRAQFLAQLAHESSDLTRWSELYNGSSDTYFINQYWVNKKQWEGLGMSVPTKDGITIKVPAPLSGPDQVAYDLYWSTTPQKVGATLGQGPQLFESGVTFTKSHESYTADFAGAVPNLKYATYLVVVDPETNQVRLAIHNKLGNWSPQDATNFRGRGPIQITGRYNYQKFADYANLPDLMASPQMLSDKVTNPSIGMEAAGWYWEVFDDLHLNEVVDSLAGESSAVLTAVITKKINGGYNGFGDRLDRYLGIRSALLNPNF